MNKRLLNKIKHQILKNTQSWLLFFFLYFVVGPEKDRFVFDFVVVDKSNWRTIASTLKWRNKQLGSLVPLTLRRPLEWIKRAHDSALKIVIQF